ncbi:MAG TPA: 5'-nucleotidase C-terminal domain-containing protein [Zoogloea sp.]|uniref:bifunctional metallophosphatase/5'-nucleotidase n=1 Tax=Zoogloea sp. TaxID=49181 RepID=UPI002BB9C5D6|nr:5'-nucleotidase C-terminal domain-containing protein [Zoogloea sp.]HNB65050.1 5'-nucleotidase C-terminal domain-containing protein [Rhodocyclaceae bacterium]HNI47979.1 5'-nucleotidase C-terminal domain-containing protein [Zoogloea sp.]
MKRPVSTKMAAWLAALSTAWAVTGCGGGASSSESAAPVSVKLIAMNDFHGNIEVPAANNGGSVVLKDPANAAGTTVRSGGAAYLATLIKQLKAQNPYSIVVGAGDMVGASPVTSTLTHDEATVDILNQIGLEVTSVGNHEFDHGKTELLRLQNGGCYPGGTIGQDTCIKGGSFSGATYKWLSANVVDSSSGQSLFPATYVKKFGPVSVGFIGLTLKGTPQVVTSTGVAGLDFQDEATTINKYAASLKASGVNAVVVLIHQGGQTTASTLNDKTCPNLTGDILPIVDALSSNVDVVVSGHTHQEYVCTRNGKLLTSTGFYGSAVTEINLTLLPGGGVLTRDANTRPVINDLNTTVPAGFSILTKDATIDAAVQSYVSLSATLKNQVVGSITADIKRALLSSSSTPTRDETAEGAMGDVMADVYLAGGPKADIAFINPGGVRADLIYKNGGAVTYGDLLTVAPFGNTLVTVDLTGADLVRLLEQQWEAPNCAAKTGANGCGRMLQPSSTFSYTWDASKPAGAAVGSGNRVVAGSLKLNGVAMDLTKTYRVTLNSFMAPGPGDNFSVVTANGKNVTPSGVIDIDAFVGYMKAHPSLAPPAARITRLN